MQETKDDGSIPASGRSLGRRRNPLQYSCLEKLMDRGAWWATVHRVTKSDMTEVTQHTHTKLTLKVVLLRPVLAHIHLLKIALYRFYRKGWLYSAKSNWTRMDTLEFSSWESEIGTQRLHHLSEHGQQRCNWLCGFRSHWPLCTNATR